MQKMQGENHEEEQKKRSSLPVRSISDIDLQLLKELKLCIAFNKYIRVELTPPLEEVSDLRMILALALSQHLGHHVGILSTFSSRFEELAGPTNYICSKARELVLENMDTPENITTKLLEKKCREGSWK